ncbi:MAG: pyridoxamine 5'-phosphate oxidase family protein [Pseudomonadales bacterium]
MITWSEFETAAPDIARTGRSLLDHPGRGEVAILATVDLQGRPRLSPVCPIFCHSGVYLSVGAHTPKSGHLQRDGRYALHAQVGADDLEFQISGMARLVESKVERDAVVAAIPFPSFDASDPIVELLIDRALVVTWPDRTTRGVKTVWRAAEVD